MVLLLSIAIIIIIIWGIVYENNKKIRAVAKVMQGFDSTYRFIDYSGRGGIAMNEPKGTVFLLKNVKGSIQERIISYKDIIGSEVYEDGETVSQTDPLSKIGGALVGDALGGNTGAIIGGLSAKTVSSVKVKRIELRLLINDTSAPTYDVCFLDKISGYSRDSKMYKGLSEASRQWHARMGFLIKRAQDEKMGKNEKPQNAAITTPAVPGISDELKKLAALRAEGILTDDEFDRQKAKLLGRF